MYEDRLPQVQGWWLSDQEYILKDKSTAFGNPDYRSEPLDKKNGSAEMCKARMSCPSFSILGTLP